MARYLIALLLTAFVMACDVSDPVSPSVPKAGTSTAASFFPIAPPDTVRPWEFRDYPRTKFAARRTLIPIVDLLPVSRFYDTATHYTGVSAPRTGTCTAIPVHGFRFDRSGTDTLRLDLWLTTECIGIGGNYTELRLLWDQRSARYADVLRANVRIEQGDYDEERRFIWSRGILAKYADPSGWCLDRPNLWQLSTSPVIPIPTLYTCRDPLTPGDPSPGDTLRLTVTIEPPVLADDYTCLPTPSLIVAELTDPLNGITAYAPLFFLTCSP